MTPATIPPVRHRGERHHWLVERAHTGPGEPTRIVREWYNDMWDMALGPQTPEQAWEAGWAYDRPCPYPGTIPDPAPGVVPTPGHETERHHYLRQGQRRQIWEWLRDPGLGDVWAQIGDPVLRTPAEMAAQGWVYSSLVKEAAVPDPETRWRALDAALRLMAVPGACFAGEGQIDAFAACEGLMRRFEALLREGAKPD